MKKLNLGCGTDIRDGWINLDIVPLPGVDVVHDVDDLPLPFGDGEFDEILCLDVLEHVDYIPLLKECHRLLAPGGTVLVEVPHFSSNNNYVDPTHRNRFSIKTFNFFTEGTHERNRRGHYYFDFSFSRIGRRRIEFHRSPAFFWNFLVSSVVNLSARTMQYYEATGFTYLFPAVNVRIALVK